MKSKLYLVLAFCLLLAGCGASNQKASVELTSLPGVTATPEVVVNSAAIEPLPVTSESRSLAETVRVAVIISDNANLRKTGNAESEVIDTIPEGAEIEVLRQKGGWFYVRVEEQTGWLHGNAFRFGEAPKETEIAEDEDLPQLETEQRTLTTVQPQIYYAAPTPSPRVIANTVWNKSDDIDGTRRNNSVAENEADRDDDPDVTPGTAPGYTPAYPGYMPSYDTSPGVESVRGYTRKDGTYVAPYKRTKRDSTTLNNFSTKGNVNPFTGKRGSRKP